MKLVRGNQDQYAFPCFRLHAAVIGVSGRVPHQAYFFVPAKHATADRALEPEGSPPDSQPGYCGALFAYIITARHTEVTRIPTQTHRNPDMDNSAYSCKSNLWRGSLSERLFFGMLALVSLLAALAGGPAVADDSMPATPPQATIEEMIAKTLAVLHTNQDAVRKNPLGVMKQITGIVDPYVDFNIVSEGVLGVGWRRADEQQRARFARAFHRLLENDFADVFKRYTGQTIKVTGVRWEDDARHRAIVSSQVEAPGAQSVEVDFHLYQTGGKWKIYDVVVDGVSLLLNYREEFASELEHESLDALIAQLEQKVAAAGVTH
jgi:phospholipid transport system substrate-binding protein